MSSSQIIRRPTRRFSTPFNAPYYTTISALEAIIPPPNGAQVSLAGRTYIIDTSFEPYRRDAFRHRSIPAQREAIDLTNEPGEGTVNTQDLWRRGQSNWVLGAGQPYLDRKESNPSRFWQSKGLETGFTWRLTLLPKSRKVYTSSSSTISVICVSGYVYVWDGTHVKFSTNLVTWTTVSGVPAITTTTLFKGWTTNGTTLWIAFASGGLYKTIIGAFTMSRQVTGTVTMVSWGGVYLMASSGAKLYQIKTGGTLPATPLYTHPNPAWIWTAMTWGDSELYIAGYVNASGGSGAIFRTATISTTNPVLALPVLALPFEGGERPYSLFAYLNFVFIGTNLGVRMARTIAAYDPSGNAGDLEVGAIQPNIFQQIKHPVYAITAHNRFVYFGWTNFDTTSSGLGRLDLANFVDTLTPAYVSDMMVTTEHHIAAADWLALTGTVLGVKGAYSSPLVAVAFTGVWVNDPTLLTTTGYLDSGYSTFGVPDTKVAMQLSLKAQQPLGATFNALVSADARLSTGYLNAGRTYPTNVLAPYPLPQLRGNQFQVRVVISTAQTGQTSPELIRWTLKAYPCIVAGIQISPVLLLFREVNEQGAVRAVDPYAEYEFLEGLRQAQQIVRYVEASFTRTVIITALDWLPHAEQGNAGNRRGYNADLVVYLKTLPQTSA